jgi:hypothetical protein
MFRSFQSKISLLLAAVVLALAIAVSTPTDAQDAPTQQRWEYAQVIFITANKAIVVEIGDEDEQDTLQATLDDLPTRQVGNVPIMNIMGDVGWELITLDNSQAQMGFLSYLFKRPME